MATDLDPRAASTSTLRHTLAADSVSAPPYSAQPRIDERVLEHTHLPHRALPTGTFKRANEHVALTLHAQRDGALAPSYGRLALVRGDVEPNCLFDVESVSVKLEGHLDMTLGGTREASTRFFSVKRTLWSAPESLFFPAPRCAPRLAFEVNIPATFRGRNRQDTPLPPSCAVAFADSSEGACTVACRYTLTVSVEKTPRLGMFRRKKRCVLCGSSRGAAELEFASFTVDVQYNPQSLPSRPVVPPYLPLSPTAASAPEGWQESVAVVQMRHSSGIQPVQCHLYVPPADAYSVSSPLPFHVRLAGPAASLRALCPGTEPPVCVRLVRHIHASAHGRHARGELVLGEGPLCARPSESADALAWDGALRCADDVAVGVGALAVDDLLSIEVCSRSKFVRLQGGADVQRLQDFVAVSVCVPGVSVEMEHLQRIRLVDDRWNVGESRILV
ncbi:hypothetical protein HWV62_19549 [Athelia sp. TMB]|nr:hypothetical protein HWV62_19549 [Athelia sp. TMB]